MACASTTDRPRTQSEDLTDRLNALVEFATRLTPPIGMTTGVECQEAEIHPAVERSRLAAVLAAFQAVEAIAAATPGEFGLEVPGRGRPDRAGQLG